LGFNPIEYFGGQVPDEETLEDLRKDPRFSGNFNIFILYKIFYRNVPRGWIDVNKTNVT